MPTSTVLKYLDLIYAEITGANHVALYQGKTNAEIADYGNDTLVSGPESGVVNSADVVRVFMENETAFNTVWAALSAGRQKQLEMMISAGSMDLSTGTPARNFLTTIFPVDGGDNDALRADLGALVATQQTTWRSLGVIGLVKEGHIRAARVRGGEPEATVDGPLP